MKYFCLTNDKEISGDYPEEINLKQALSELENFPSLGEYKGPEGGPFLGFVNENEEVIQFGIRDKENDLWTIDIPILYNNEFVFSFESTSNTSELNDIINAFFSGLRNYDALLSAKRTLSLVEDEIDDIKSFESDIGDDLIASYHLLVNTKNEVLAEAHIEDKEQATELILQIESKYESNFIPVQSLLKE